MQPRAILISCSALAFAFLAGCGSDSGGTQPASESGGSTSAAATGTGGSGAVTGGANAATTKGGAAGNAGTAGGTGTSTGTTGAGGQSSTSGGAGTQGGTAGNATAGGAAGSSTVGGAGGNGGTGVAGSTALGTLRYCQACDTSSDCADKNAACLAVSGQKVCAPNCDTAHCSETGQVCQRVEDGHQYCLPASNDCACTAVTARTTRACAVTNDYGSCKGVASCDPTQGFVGCNARTATAEMCNAVDDDCDGAVDEDFPTLGTACDGPDVDSCQHGTTVCAITGLGTACSAETVTGIVEICDGLDNNCDGVIDEGCDADGDGYCRAGAQVIANPAVCPNGTGDCDDTNAAIHPSAKEICDGFDNDCSGQIDDAITGAPPNENQVGACNGSTKLCVAGNWQTSYALVPTYGQLDKPDGAFLDGNCDGLDGSAATGVFVSDINGSDDAAAIGACSKSYPCKTIAHAIEVGVAQSRPEIYVAAGTYSGVVELVSGIEIYGGFDVHWGRAPYTNNENRVTLTGGKLSNGESVVIYASGLTAKATVADVVIAAPDAPAVTESDANKNGRSSYGAYVINSLVDFERVRFIGGKGADGYKGTDGVPLAQASSGIKGENGGAESGSHSTRRGAGGGKGTNQVCPSTRTDGGNGGLGGMEDASGSYSDPGPGDKGSNSETATGGWGGGAANDNYAGNGGPGGPGAPADTVANAGTGGTRNTSRGALTAEFWYALPGGNGESGKADGGGGAGGGGGGGADENLPNEYGAGGGGGGAGGCRATSVGMGGGGGGSSFGLFTISSMVTITGCEFQIGTGGKGGVGGKGSLGQPGGSGGPGGNRAGYGGAGGQGGNGGNGANSGSGAGGNGGIAYGIFFKDTALTAVGNTFSAGAFGFGGAGGDPLTIDNIAVSVGANGLSGTTGETFDCSTEPECSQS